MKNIALIFLLFFVFTGVNLCAQDFVGQNHKQILEYWQKSLPAEQISDNNDLLVVNGTTYFSFQKKICVEYTTTFAATELEKYKAELNANKDLRYDEKTESWINTTKKCSWKFTKVSETDYELSCKKL